MTGNRGSVELRRFDAQFIAWLAWIPFVFPIVLASDPLRPDMTPWVQVIGGHALIGLAIAVLQPPLAVAAIYPAVPREIPVDVYYRNVLNQLFVIDFIVYVGCVVAYLARFYWRRSHIAHG